MALLTGGVVLAGVAGAGGAIAGAAIASPEQIRGIYTTATLDEGGSAQVVEVIDYDFSYNNRHGIERTIPGLSPDTRFEVRSDAPSQVEATPLGPGTRFRIGDPDRTISGQHRYTLDYDLPGVVRGGVIDWETFGNEWPVDAEDVEAHMVAPFEIDQPQCFVGSFGTSNTCTVETVEPGHVVARIDEVPSGEGVSIEGRQGAALSSTPTVDGPPPVPPEEDTGGTGPAPPALAALGGAALAAYPVSRLVRRAGREVVSAGGAADMAYAGSPDPTPAYAPGTGTGASAGPAPQYASWPTPAGPYPVTPRPAPPAGPLPPPPGSPGGPVDDGDPDHRPPPPGAPGAPGTAGHHGGAIGALLTGHHPHPAPPPAVGRIGEPIAGPPQWLPTDELRLDEAELAEMATIEFAPPAELTPAHGGIVLTETVEANHKAAWLVQAAIQGDIHIEESGQKAVGLVRTGPGDEETRAFLDQAFGGRQQVSLLAYDKQFSTAWSALGSQLQGWRRTCGLWDRKADNRRVAWAVFGGLALLVAAAVTILGAIASGASGAWGLPIVAAGALLGGAGIALLVRSWELRVRTAAGSGLWLRVESFRRFLAGSEAYHAEEAARRGVLREYTAWALALGEIDRWRMAVLSATDIPVDTPGLGYVWLGSSIIASTAKASTAPSSSGGGGSFGGGGIGGGAGGGGGGSW